MDYKRILHPKISIIPYKSTFIGIPEWIHHLQIFFKVTINIKLYFLALDFGLQLIIIASQFKIKLGALSTYLSNQICPNRVDNPLPAMIVYLQGYVLNNYRITKSDVDYINFQLIEHFSDLPCVLIMDSHLKTS